MIDMFYFISCAIHHRFGCRRLDLGLQHYDFLCHTLQGFHIPQLLIQSHQLIQGVEAVRHDGKSLLVSLFRIFRIKYIICILLFIYFSKNLYQINWSRLIPKMWEDFSFCSLNSWYILFPTK